MECTVRRCLLLLPWLTGAGAGEGAARGPGSLRPAGCDGYRSPRASPQGCAGRAWGEGRGRGRSKLTSGVPRALCGARVQGVIPQTLDCKRCGSELELGLGWGVGFLQSAMGSLLLTLSHLGPHCTRDAGLESRS